MVFRINRRKLDTESTLTTKEVAELTGYTRQTINRYAQLDLIPSGGSPGKRLFNGQDVASFLGLSSGHPNPSPLVN